MFDSFKKMFRLFSRRDHAKLAGLFIMMFVASFLEVLGIGMIPLFVVAVSNPESLLQYPILGNLLLQTGITTAEQLVVYGAAVLLAVYVFKNLYLGIFTYLKKKFTANRGVHLENRLFEAYMASPYTFYISRNSAELLRNVTSETNKVINGVMLPFMELTLNTIMLTVILGTLLILEPLVTLVTMVTLGGAGGIFLRYTRHKVQAHGLEDRRSRKLKNKSVLQGLGGLKVTRILNRERHFLESYRESAERSKNANIYSHVVSTIPKFITETLAVVAILLIALLLLWEDRPVAAIVPIVALFGAATLRLLPAFNKAISEITAIQFNAPSVDAVYTDLNLLDNLDRGARHQILADTSGRLVLSESITIRDLSFSYPGQREDAVDRVSLDIPHGSAVALVGHSGAGKTTMVDLILGLLAPTAGEICVDGVNIETNIRGWQRNLGYIPQHIYLLDDTIARNIAFGIPEDEVDEARLEMAIEAAQLGELIRTLPAGRNTTVGERGVRLSGGQQQRIGIARALYGNPQVLIMDEATSALDNVTEKYVIGAVERLRGDRTIIMIAHRLTTVANCDTIYLMKDGAIVAQGSYEDLMLGSPDFRRMSLVEE
jgi:ATP-binding cassette, subfamily B, bacterial PglK